MRCTPATEFRSGGFQTFSKHEGSQFKKESPRGLEIVMVLVILWSIVWWSNTKNHGTSSFIGKSSTFMGWILHLFAFFLVIPRFFSPSLGLRNAQNQEGFNQQIQQNGLLISDSSAVLLRNIWVLQNRMHQTWASLFRGPRWFPQWCEATGWCYLHEEIDISSGNLT